MSVTRLQWNVLPPSSCYFGVRKPKQWDREIVRDAGTAHCLFVFLFAATDQSVACEGKANQIFRNPDNLSCTAREISSLREIAVHRVKSVLPFGLAQLRRAGSTTSAAQLHTKSRAPWLVAPLALVLSQGRSPVRTPWQPTVLENQPWVQNGGGRKAVCLLLI